MTLNAYKYRLSIQNGEVLYKNYLNVSHIFQNNFEYRWKTAKRHRGWIDLKNYIKDHESKRHCTGCNIKLYNGWETVKNKDGKKSKINKAQIKNMLKTVKTMQPDNSQDDFIEYKKGN